MLIGNLLYRLKLNNNFTEANEIRNILLTQRPTFVFQLQRILGLEWNTLQAKLNLQAFLIDIL